MKTIKKVPVTYEKVKLMEQNKKYGIIYISDEYQIAVHTCLCGCGIDVITPIDPSGWLYSITDKGLTLTPSIGNYKTCGSHYIITNGVANFV